MPKLMFQSHSAKNALSPFAAALFMTSTLAFADGHGGVGDDVIDSQKSTLLESM